MSALAPAVFAVYLATCAAQDPVVLEAPAGRPLAHAMAESGLRPTALHDNTTGRSYVPETQAEAVALARQLLAAGHRIDAGVMQITDRNWPAYGLTVETAFDPKSNICAGARILGEAFRIERRAACRYNAGRPDCGPAYPAFVEKAAARLRVADSAASIAAATPGTVPEPPPCAPSWDGWALIDCTTAHKEASRQ